MCACVSGEPPKTGHISIDVGVPLYIISYGIYHGVKVGCLYDTKQLLFGGMP